MKIADRDLIALKCLPSLKRLSIPGTAVGNEGVACWGRIGIEPLNLAATQAHLDRIMPTLAEFPLLEELELSGTKITDAGLTPLAEFPRLKVLGLSGTLVSDRGAVSLERCSRLMRVYLMSTRVSKNAVAKLQQAVPRLAVSLYSTTPQARKP